MASGDEREEGEEGHWEVKFREDEELEFFTELALHETERWIGAVTKKSFEFPEDPRKSLENGILLCELLNTINPGSVKRINKLPTPIAGLDNLHVFLKACRQHFGLNDTQLFDPADLEDLSQRAIADSEHLKEELDRRLRNVAITVYWVGRVACQTYQGPKIDESAFAALVHNQHRHREHIVSDGQLRRDSSTSWQSSPSRQSSVHGAQEGGSCGDQERQHTDSLRDRAGEFAGGGGDQDSVDGPRHVRDGSYDSYSSCGKGSLDSLDIDECDFEVDENGMPIPRYNSQSALNHSSREGGAGAGVGRRERGGSRESGGEHDSMYSFSDRHSGLYQSSPDLSHGALSKRRTSSTDGSTDGSHGGGGHSRQSSDSMEYPTRRYSTTVSARKTSVSSDPLQFIKVKGASNLACAAEEQMKLVEETKKLKITESITEDEDTAWQSNLASWKNRRKSHSSQSYQLKEELEQMEREKEEPGQTSASSVKTFSQMKEERERRKSAPAKHFYPIEDEGEEGEEDDIFSPGAPDEKHSTPASRTSNRFQSSLAAKEDTKDTRAKGHSRDKMAAQAQDSGSEEEEEEVEEAVTTNNHNSTTASEPRASRFSRGADSTTASEPRSSRFSRDNDSSNVAESRASRFSRDNDNSTAIQSRASRFSRDGDSTNNAEPRSSRFSRDEDSGLAAYRARRSGLPEQQGQDKKDSWRSQYSDSGRDSALKENNRNSANSSAHAPRSTGKISNILKSFEHKEEEDGARRGVGVNSHSVDVGARKKSFEQSGGRSSAEVDSFRSWSTDRGRAGKISSRTEVTSSMYASSRNSGKDYVEKVIKISQKPNSAKGFGFTLSGGADKKQPVVVEKVGLGSAADVCELQTKDEVISMNGQSVTRLTSVELTTRVQEAVKTGSIELRVKRFLGSADDMEDEDFLSTDEDVDTPDRSVSKSSSIRAENSFDSLDSRDGPQRVEEESDRPCIEVNIPPTSKTLNNRRGDPTSTSSDSGYDAQTFSPYLSRGGNSSNEEELAPSTHQGTESQQAARPGRGLRTRYLYPRDEEEEENDYVNLPPTTTTTTAPTQSGSPLKHEHSDSGMGKEVAPPGEVEVQSRATITVRRGRGGGGGGVAAEAKEAEEEQNNNNKPVATSEPRSQLVGRRGGEERHAEQTTSEDSDSGPPAALRRWQRQRPRAEYTFESDDSPQSKFYDQIKMSSSTSETKHEESGLYKSSDDTDDTVRDVTISVSTRRGFRAGEDKQRIRSWNQRQEEERQPPDQPLSSGQSEAHVEITSPYAQQRFTAERENMQQVYQRDLQRAADSERHKQQQDERLLEPEMEKMRVLEERRAQRQARLQICSQDLSQDFPPPPPPSSSRSSDLPPPPASGDDNQPSQQHSQHKSTFVAQINPGKAAPSQPEVLIIDPRNRAQTGEVPVEVSPSGQPLQFQVKINSRETPQGLLIQPEVVPSLHTSPPPPVDHAAFLEAERERIRQEELQRIEAERLKREQEEQRVIREKEERLRQQEENLRRQEEELRRTQERLEQERMQLQQQQQQQQQQQHHMASSHNTHQAEYQHQRSPPDDDASLQFETVTSKVRGSSPVYTSTIVAPPRRSDAQRASHISRDQAHNDSYYNGAGSRGRGENAYSGGAAGRPQTASSWKGSVETVSSSQGQLPRWPPADEQHRGTSGGRGQYSSAPPAHDGSSSSTHREAGRAQMHSSSISSAPRPRSRHSEGWGMGGGVDGVGGGGGERSQQQQPARRSEAYRSHFSGPQDHWLVQEAERRRLNNSGSQGQGQDNHAPSRAQFSGPIKPVTDSYGNRWREEGGGGRRGPNMPAQLRQTLLQKTAGARGSTASNSSQDSLGFQSSDSTASMSQQHHTLPANYGYSAGYSPRSQESPMPPPQHQQHQHHAPPTSHVDGGRGDPGGMNLSGKQRCSHCSQELGFGAAMVIESLGLYYHTNCFRCCVCRTPLGSGVEGADVRVRVNKLHCPNCYSNDEAGLKFSKV